jgi:farnesyl-diphosphate farnesyltransferase
VAGIVGELLTELFVCDAPHLGAMKPVLIEHQHAFGEGLQLINILKDQIEDEEEGRRWLPPQVPRSEIVALARRDLAQARAYIAALARGNAPGGFIAFTSLPAELADAALSCIEREGPGAKVPRSEVMRMLSRFQYAAAGAEADHSASAHSGK